MKVKNEAIDIFKSDEIVETSFGISVDDSAHILAILRDKLYSNKILAVIREYSTNAYDAHVEANKEDRPIRVELPSRLNPVFSVRDYGFGLTEADVRNIYAMYGASTKRSSNAYTGQLGLGCKSGFSYSDRFSITTWRDGIKQEYCAYLDESTKGKVALMNTESSNEEDGVLIQIPVDLTDIGSFISTAKSFFPYFKVLPEIPGHELQVKNYFLTEDIIIKHENEDLNVSYSLSDIERYSRGDVYIVMGNIKYELDDDQVKEKNRTRCDILLRVPIGSVSIAANRETLEYTKDTIAFLEKTVKAVNAIYLENIQKKINECTSLKDAKSLLAQVDNDSYSSVFDNITWTEAATSKVFKVRAPIIRIKRDDNDDYPVGFNLWSSVKYRQKRRYEAENNIPNSWLKKKDNFSILYLDKPCQWKTKVTRWANQNNDDTTIVIIAPSSDGIFDFAKVKEYWKLDEYDIKNISDLKIIAEEKVIGNKVVKVSYDHVGEIFKFKKPEERTGTGKKSVDEWVKTTWEEAEKNTIKFYAPIYCFKITNNKNGILEASRLDQLLSVYNHFNPATPISHNDIHGIKDIKELDESWINIEDFLKEKVLTKENSDLVRNAQISRHVVNEMGYYFNQKKHIINKESLAYQYIELCEVAKTAQEKIKNTYLEEICAYYDFVRSYHYHGYHYDNLAAVQTETEKELNLCSEKIKERYPMVAITGLFPMDSSKRRIILTDDHISEVINYINLVEGERK